MVKEQFSLHGLKSFYIILNKNNLKEQRQTSSFSKLFEKTEIAFLYYIKISQTYEQSKVH